MSQAVKAAMLASKDLRPNERLILVAIAAHSNRDGDAWPSVATIAEYAGVSARTVQRCLAKLVELGRLVVRQVANITTRVYRLVTGQGDNQSDGVTERNPEGDTQSVTRSSEDYSKKKNGADAPSWRRFLKSKTPEPQQQTYGYPERRGAALPPERHVSRCASHPGSPAHNCGPCRSEALGGAA
ncbi:helix-turn-helix domain-containing protein [Dactylosporangium sp. NBC_01737]|uniref:helix-turn-helix domain-containing protein n=1 Tax=Dactylosporangium sp. NBC_01737 TaxID=2975959 RepID=UPI002E12AA26|nr:helix-turn-helix domain-containing protein [Dactylosporangium sp. NBC_01737]